VRARLLRVDVPDETGARERAWGVVRAAYAGLEPTTRRRTRPWALAVAVGLAAVVAVAFTPPGSAVLDSLRRAVGVERAARALFSLPTSGRLLVVSPTGAWIVHPDGSKRRLGRYRDATWSPHGLFVAATTRDELRALEADGDVRWSLARPLIGSPRWGGRVADTRIAYVSGRDLRVVAGDGTGDRLFAPAERGPLAWRPGSVHQLAYVSASEVRLQDTDSGRVLWRARTGAGLAATDLAWSADGRRLLAVSPTALVVFDAQGRERRRISATGPTFVAAAVSPRGELAYVRRHPSGSSDVVLGSGRRVFAGTGEFTSLAWSPDGRWLLMGWPTANQWVFVRVAGPRRIVAAAGIAAQFGGGAFPRVTGWCCARSGL
jgi:WD40 repeat protein